MAPAPDSPPEEAPDGEQAQEVETTAEQSFDNRVYHEIREKLARHGLPVEQVAFIHDYPTRARRDELFAAMNAGQFRVLIGSTHKMGTGMNVQRRLIALHHLDAPWRPGDVEQRDGRILRPGNFWPECYIFHYVTERSFDSYLWQLLENKARFIGQVMTGEVSARTADDVGETVLTAAEVKAIASGNPRILERFTIENELARLDRVYRAWADARRALERKRHWAQLAIADKQQHSSKLAVAQRIYQAHAAAEFAVALEARVGEATQVLYTKRADAGKALLTLLAQYRTAALFQQQTIVRTIGTYRGFTLRVEAPRLELKAVKLVLATEEDGDVFDRVFEEITPHGVFASIDAGLREIADRIERNQREVAENEALIAACEAELERTAVWEGEPRHGQLRAEFSTLTAELSKAEADAAASAEPSESSHAETTATVGVEAQAAVLAAVQAIDDDPAWQVETVPLEQHIPPALASLALLHALGQVPRSSEIPTPAHDDVLAEVEELAETAAPLAAPAYSQPAATSRSPLRFGDRALIAQVRSRGTTKPVPPQPLLDDTPAQLDLFSLPTLPAPLEPARERVLISFQQLPLL